MVILLEKLKKYSCLFLCIKWCKGTNFQKYLQLSSPPLTATPTYSNNQSKLLYMAGVTIFAVTLSEKIAKIRKKQIQAHRAISHLKLASCTFMSGLLPLAGWCR